MSFFGELYLRSTRPFLSEATTQREADFIARVLELDATKRVLDIGCGHGRHLEALASRGLSVFGFDADALSIAEIRPEPRTRVARANLYAPPFRAAFDAAFAWYATLLIGDDPAQHLEALRAAASTLRPGGRLLIHGHNPLAQRREPESRLQTTLDDGATLVEEAWYDLARDVLHGKRTLTLGERVLVGSFEVHCPTRAQHATWARTLGLTLEQTWGHVGGAPCSDASPDLIACYVLPG